MASRFQTIVFFISCFWVSKFSSALDKITTTQFLSDLDQDTLSTGVFKLGFFSPINSKLRYIGIWYNKGDNTTDRQVVWVANRDNPLSGSSGVLKLSDQDGNLQLVDGQNKIFWSSNISVSNNTSTLVAELSNEGNFILHSNTSNDPMWQSFDNPTDTLLPNMIARIFTTGDISSVGGVSWKNASDPSKGQYSVNISKRGKNIYEAFVWDDNRPYYRSGPFVGTMFLGIQKMYSTANDTPFNLNNTNNTLSFHTSDGDDMHFVLKSDGIGYQEEWENGRWKNEWKTIEDECDNYKKCGEYGVCDQKKQQICHCLKGFKPRNEQEWRAGNWSSGCVRRKQLNCGTKGAKEDGFYELKYAKVPDNAWNVDGFYEENCRTECQRSCSCLAYAYYPNNSFCMHWENTTLTDIKVFNEKVGVSLFIRLNHSELENKTRRKVIIAAVVILVTVVILVVFLYCQWRRRRQQNRLAWKTSTTEEASFSMNDSSLRK